MDTPRTLTLTLNLKPVEMEALENIAEEEGMSKTAVMRQALRLYQLVKARMSNGETMSFSGDPDRAIQFIGLGF